LGYGKYLRSYRRIKAQILKKKENKMSNINFIGRRNFLKGSLAVCAGTLIFGKGQFSSALTRGNKTQDRESEVMVKVLGTAQDGGFPQMGCYCENCRLARRNPKLARKVVSLGLLNFSTGKSFMMEATPDTARQVDMIQSVDPGFKRMKGNCKVRQGVSYEISMF